MFTIQDFTVDRNAANSPIFTLFYYKNAVFEILPKYEGKKILWTPLTNTILFNFLTIIL